MSQVDPNGTGPREPSGPVSSGAGPTPPSSQSLSVADVQFARGTTSGIQLPVPNATTNTRVAIDFGWVGGVAADATNLRLNYSGSLGDTVPNADWGASHSGSTVDNMSGDAQRPFRLVAYEAQNLPGIQVLNASAALIKQNLTRLQDAWDAMPNGGQVVVPPIMYTGNNASLVVDQFAGSPAQNRVGTVRSAIPGVRPRLYGSPTNNGMIETIVIGGTATVTLQWLEMSTLLRVTPNFNGVLNFVPGNFSVTLQNCWVHHGPNGLVTGNQTTPLGVVSLLDCIFGDNGPGDIGGYGGWGGYHNVYIGSKVRRAVAYGNIFYGCDGGHLFKSRAIENDIQGCAFLSLHAPYQSATENAAINLAEMFDQGVAGVNPHKIIGCLITKSWPPTALVHGPPGPSYGDSTGDIATHPHMIQVSCENTSKVGNVRLQMYNNTVINLFDPAADPIGALGMLQSLVALPANASLDIQDNVYLGGFGSKNGVVMGTVLVSNQTLLKAPTLNTVYATSQLGTIFPGAVGSVPNYTPAVRVAARTQRTIQRPLWPNAPYGRAMALQTSMGCF